MLEARDKEAGHLKHRVFREKFHSTGAIFLHGEFSGLHHVDNVGHHVVLHQWLLAEGCNGKRWITRNN